MMCLLRMMARRLRSCLWPLLRLVVSGATLMFRSRARRSVAWVTLRLCALTLLSPRVPLSLLLLRLQLLSGNLHRPSRHLRHCWVLRSCAGG